MTALFQAAPLTFTPVYQSALWGGRDLPAFQGRPDAPRLASYAESWELADHPDGMSIADTGPCAGRSLRDLMREQGRALTGSDAAAFPLLVKIIDAADRLSVQVHPDDDGARRHGGEAKTECWFLLDAAPGACVWAGLQPGVTPERFAAALKAGTVASLLQRMPVSTGDLLFIPGGRVHAIGAGCRILEVQQRSNTTWRLFDWNRTSPDGTPRPLHLKEGMQAIRWDETRDARTPAGPAIAQGANTVRERLACPYFRLEEWTLRGPRDEQHAGDSFHVLFTVSGSLHIGGHGFRRHLPPRTTALLPAALTRYRLEPAGDTAQVIRITRG